MTYGAKLKDGLVQKETRSFDDCFILLLNSLVPSASNLLLFYFCWWHLLEVVGSKGHS